MASVSCNEDVRMTARHWAALIGLTLAAFIFNTSEFVPIGLLSDIARDFGKTESETGLLISVYAWCVALLSLPLMILASRMEMRRLMLCLAGAFAAFQCLSWASGSYAMLMASRVGVACCHSVFWSIVSPMAVRLVPSGHTAHEEFTAVPAPERSAVIYVCFFIKGRDGAYAVRKVADEQFDSRIGSPAH